MAVLDAEISVEEALSDDELFFLIAQKEQNLEKAKWAFDMLYDRYAQLVLALCYKVCSFSGIANADTIAEEIFSQTIIAIYEHPTYNSSKGKISTWISRIAKSKAYDLLNPRNPKEIYLEEMGSMEPCVDEDEKVPILPKERILEEALNTLSEVERNVLITYMSYQDGRRHLPDHVLQELCDYHNKTTVNVRQIKKRALDKVEKYIQQNSELLS